MNVFLGISSVVSDGDVQIYPEIVFAETRESAIGKLAGVLYEKYPPSKQVYGHTVSVQSFSEEILTKMYKIGVLHQKEV